MIASASTQENDWNLSMHNAAVGFNKAENVFVKSNHPIRVEGMQSSMTEFKVRKFTHRVIDPDFVGAPQSSRRRVQSAPWQCQPS
jgi:hypothetical protein